jgi:acylphosphatase
MSGVSSSGHVRRRVVYSGRVQGVCFRATAQELSRKTVVVGFVRNLPDGRVELEAEGAARHVDDFINSVERHFEGFIAQAARTDVALREDESSFEIRP